MSRDAAAQRLIDRFVGRPEYPPDARDLRTINVAGLELPLRATVALAFVTLALLLDFSRTLTPESIQDLGRAAPAMRFQATERLVLFGLLPLAIVVLGFRDRPSRYGLRIGDWRWGIGLAVLGCAVMTPVILVLAGMPAFREYYAISSASPVDLVITNMLDLLSAEFLIRGFLMFAMLRVLGPIAVLVVTLPFVFAHLGKPEIELYSTLAGGLIYGWVNWRTGSILWSAAAHIYIVTLLLVAAAPG